MDVLGSVLATVVLMIAIFPRHHGRLIARLVKAFRDEMQDKGGS